jgi:hypothetical protein
VSWEEPEFHQTPRNIFREVEPVEDAILAVLKFHERPHLGSLRTVVECP